MFFNILKMRFKLNFNTFICAIAEYIKFAVIYLFLGSELRPQNKKHHECQKLIHHFPYFAQMNVIIGLYSLSY